MQIRFNCFLLLIGELKQGVRSAAPHWAPAGRISRKKASNVDASGHGSNMSDWMSSKSSSLGGDRDEDGDKEGIKSSPPSDLGDETQQNGNSDEDAGEGRQATLQPLPFTKQTYAHARTDARAHTHKHTHTQ